MIPLIKKKFGDNLVALAAQASYARNEDFHFSDLELIAFVNEMPKDKKLGEEWGGMGRVRDGLLVELVWMTKETYLKEVKEVTKNWYIAGSDVLLPIINETFVAELNSYKVENLEKKCLNHAAQHWYEVQESTAKVLNAVTKGNREGIPLLVSDMLLNMLIVLSFLNETPYVTFAEFVSQARDFKLKPNSFQRLTDMIVEGDYGQLSLLQKAAIDTFSEFEKIFEDLGFDLYDDNVDPNQPAKKFVE